MNRILTVTVVLASFFSGGVAAVAADLGVPSPAPERRCGGGPFQGIYAGVHAGGVNYTANRTDADAFLGGGIFLSPATYSTTSASALLGGQAGYNFQCQNAVVGIEVDGSWTNAIGTFRAFPDFGAPLSTVTSKLNSFDTVRARAGIVAADMLLFYMTGGIAVAHTNTTWSVSFPGLTDAATFSEWNFGWTAGFGVEWALSERLSLRSEVLYANFPDRNLTFNSLFIGPATVTHSDSMWIARFGANIRLTKD
jgi:outer membrane immunogenic protein